MAAIECDKYGFFNGIYGIEQSNWANYWKGLIPDGVVSGIGNEMAVYALSDGMRVHVNTGEAMVDNHRAWLNTEKIVEIPAADGTNPRIDLIVLRVVYGNSKMSKIYVDVKTGTPAATPTPPTLVQVTGETYEIALAQVAVASSVVTIAEGNVTDIRYVFKLGSNSAVPFSGTSLAVKNDIDHRNNTAIGSLVITLPASPNDTFISGVCFTANASFTGVTFQRNNESYSPKLQGTPLTLKSVRYNLTIWWDGAYFWCNSEAA